MITQEQANAIAEREYPEPDMVNEDFPTRFRVKLSVRIERKAYAKALMDMNPLIKAAHGLRWVVQCADDGHKFFGRRQQSMDDYDTALSKLTKSIEP